MGRSIYMLCSYSFCADQKSENWLHQLSAQNLIWRVVCSSSWHVTCLEPLL